MDKILVAPSILSADFARLGEEVKKVSEAGADMIHIDVMDGHFVPNLTVGPDIVKAIRNYSKLPFDVHLMVDRPEHFIELFVKAGANIITVHFEAEKHLIRLLNKIKSYGVKTGISILPTTNPKCLEYLMGYLDLILVMTVDPGFGGQKFIPNQLSKIRQVRDMIDIADKDIILSIDGGVNDSNISDIVSAGAHMVVAGNYIFSAKDTEYKQRIGALKKT